MVRGGRSVCPVSRRNSEPGDPVNGPTTLPTVEDELGENAFHIGLHAE